MDGTFSTEKLGLFKGFVSVKGTEFYENRLDMVWLDEDE